MDTDWYTKKELEVQPSDDAGPFIYLHSKRLFVFDNYFNPLIFKKEI